MDGVPPVILGGPPLSPFHTIARTGDDLERMVRTLRARPTRGFDFETSGLRYANGDHPIGYAMGVIDTNGSTPVWYVPVRHQTADRMVPEDQAKQAFADALDGADRLVAHNMKFDLNMGRAHGYVIPESAEVADTMIQANLIYERRSKQLERLAESITDRVTWDDPWEMKNLVDQFLSRRAGERRMRFKKDDKETGEAAYMSVYGHAEVPVSYEAEYSCRDVAHALWLDATQVDDAMGIGTPYEHQRRYLYWNEMLFVRALADMEYVGQPVDRDYLFRLAHDIDGRLDRLALQLCQLFGTSIEWSSDNAVRDYLYNYLQLPVVKRTEKGDQPAVDRGAMLMLRPFVSGTTLEGLVTLAEYNAWLKARQTYTKSLAWWVDADGRIHASFNQNGTRSGRLSGRDPNLQNIPTRHKEIGAAIRRAFYVPEGVSRIYIDYSQIELRFLAWITGCGNLVNAYLSPAYDAYCYGNLDYNQYVAARHLEEAVDVHSNQAKNTFGAKETDSDWKNKRRAAKIINFGVPYGMGAPGLTGNPELMLDPATAEDYFARYHAANPEIGVTKQALFNRMRSHDGAPRFINWAGRAVHMPELRSPVKDIRSDGERSAFACLIQGSAGELTRFSIVRTYLAHRSGDFPARGTSTVHDEVQFDCATPDVVEVGQKGRYMMEDFRHFGRIPVVADLEVTETTWAEKRSLTV